MEQVNIIGIDLAKRSFQLHGARADGSVAFRRKVSRERLLYILGAQQRCVVAMEACASAHYWGREILKLGHEVRLVPPIYVKPFVKRQKNDAADAEAICEAAQRPTMRFVAVKGEEQQARAMLFHTRDLLVRQRTQTINALRGQPRSRRRAHAGPAVPRPARRAPTPSKRPPSQLTPSSPSAATDQVLPAVGVPAPGVRGLRFSTFTSRPLSHPPLRVNAGRPLRPRVGSRGNHRLVFPSLDGKSYGSRIVT